MTTIALIDDHLIVRSGFAQLLNLEPDFQVVAEFGSGREALAGLPAINPLFQALNVSKALFAGEWEAVC